MEISPTSAAIGVALERIRRIRGWEMDQERLRFSRVAPDEMSRLVKEDWEQAEPPDARRKLDSAFVLFGVLPRGFDTISAILRDFSEQRRAAYLPSKHLIAVPEANSLPRETDALVHELVHAFQDVRYGVGKRLTFELGASDAIAAYAALAEGEALHVEQDLAMLDARDTPHLESEDATTLDSRDEPAPIPSLVRRSLRAPYVDGFAFVSYLRSVGGLLHVERVWRCDTLGTSDVLHPERWLPSTGAFRCPPEERESFSSEHPPWTAGSHPVHVDILGEAALRAILAEGVPFKDAERRAAEYAGDRIDIFWVGAWRTVLWRIRTRTESGLVPLCEGLVSTLAPQGSNIPGPGGSCWDRGEASLALSCSKRDILVLGREPADGRVSATNTFSCPAMLGWLGALESTAR